MQENEYTALHIACCKGLFEVVKEIIKRYNNRLGGNIAVYSMDEWQSFQFDTIKQKKPMELLFQKYLKKFYK